MKQIFISLFIIISVGILICGCEESSNNEGLVLSPSSTTIAATNSTLWVSVVSKNDQADKTSGNSGSTSSTGTTTTVSSQMMLDDLSYPLEWSVSDLSLGIIVESSGDSALYQRTSKSGNQIITAKDQYGNEGYSSVKQL